MYYTPPAFSDADRKQCLPMIDRIMSLGVFARREGILFLIDKTHHEPQFMVRKAIELIWDGLDQDLLRVLLTTLMHAEHYTGAALLERMIIIEGMLSIQAGDNPRILEERMTLMLGETFLKSETFQRWYDTHASIRAAAYFDKPIAADPNNAELYASRAFTYRYMMELKDLPLDHAALAADWAKAIELKPDHDEWWEGELRRAQEALGN